jgi:hypothetical protein
MDKEKVDAFRNTLREYRDYTLRGIPLTVSEKMEILEKLQDTWYQPLCICYNLLAPFQYPKYIKNQYQQAKEVEDGKIFLWIHLTYGEWLDRDKLDYAMVNVAEDNE